MRTYTLVIGDKVYPPETELVFLGDVPVAKADQPRRSVGGQQGREQTLKRSTDAGSIDRSGAQRRA